jgi:beta-lactamase class A
MNINKNLVSNISLVLIVATATYFLTAQHFQKREDTAFAQVKSVREKNSGYTFINPLLAYDLPESKEFGEYSDLNNKLNTLIDQFKSERKVDDVSIYFRGNQGRWVGINDSDSFYPASLLKVVIMMAYYEQAQTNPSVLGNQLTYTSDIQKQLTVSEFNTPSALKLNTNYKIDDLIRYMIVESDNGATYTLLNSLNSKALDDVYTDFGLQAPNDSSAYEISAKDYSLFFRILYNATYLNREYSEKALSLLSQSTFHDGLAAGLPNEVKVAHKFGEHVLNDANGEETGVELHDCGLIYAQQSFLLCVMTRGNNVNNLKTVISEITKLVYKETN